MELNGKEFKAIPGYNGYYASEDAEVYSELSSKIMKASILGCMKYKIVTIKKNRKTAHVPLHKLVALAWCPLPSGYTPEEVLGNYMNRNLVVDHIDGDKLNNNANNLRWLTNYENINAGNYDFGRRGARPGNKNACGRKLFIGDHKRYIYFYEDKPYFGVGEIAEKLQCSKSKITESFRNNYGLVKQGKLTRIENTKKITRKLYEEAIKRLKGE